MRNCMRKLCLQFFLYRRFATSCSEKKDNVSYRYMRVIVMFDLPTKSSADIREYNRFRKHLVKSGFLMMQESVYCKLALNATVAEAVIANVRKNRPEHGLVQAFSMTEKQFSKIEFITGTSTSEILDTDKRLVIL